MKPVPANTACARGVNPVAAISAAVVACLWHGVGWCSFSSHPPRPTELLGDGLPLSITACGAPGAGWPLHITTSRERGLEDPDIQPCLPPHQCKPCSLYFSSLSAQPAAGGAKRGGAARRGSEGICLPSRGAGSPARAGGCPARTAPALPKSAPDCRCKVMHPLFSCFQIVFSYFQYLCFPRLLSLTVL